MTETRETLTAETASRRIGRRLFSDCGHNDLADHAESQLGGRSHYYDAGTRKYFGCRVNGLQVELGGLLLCTVESVSPPHSSRAHRAVVHDLTGTVIYRSLDDTSSSGFTTGKHARADLAAWLDAYHDEATEAERIIKAETRTTQRNLDRLTAE